MIAAVDWTNVLESLIYGLPAILAAVFAGLIRHDIRTPSGDKIGKAVENAHQTVVANNMLLKTIGNGVGLAPAALEPPPPSPPPEAT